MMFTGCGTALVTPFLEDGSLDEKTMPKDVLFVGPRAPATQRKRPGSSAMTASAARRAARAAAKLMSYASTSAP